MLILECGLSMEYKECAAPRSKQYSFLIQMPNGSVVELKKSKGTDKVARERQLTHQLFKNSILKRSKTHARINRIRMRNFEVETVTSIKLALCGKFIYSKNKITKLIHVYLHFIGFYDKRVLLACCKHTLPYGCTLITKDFYCSKCNVSWSEESK